MFNRKNSYFNEFSGRVMPDKLILSQSIICIIKGTNQTIMKRKNFIAALGLFAGGTLTGIGSPVKRELVSAPFLPTDSEGDLWKTVREEFSFPEGYVYLNTGGIGSVPRHVRSLVSDEWFKLECDPGPGHDLTKWNALKKDIATFFGPGTDASEFALVNSATEGINIILNGLPLQKGDEVITSNHEHGALNIALLNQLKRKGIVIKTFEPDRKTGLNNVTLIDNLITKKTRLIFITHKTTTTGELMPVKEIGKLARSKGIWYALDGAQAPGTMPIEVKDWNVDFYTFSSHKWVLAPRRTGVLYVTKEKLDQLTPVTVGGYSDGGYSMQERRLDYNPTAQRYEYGTQNDLLYKGFHASLRFLNSIGINKIREHNESLAELFYSEVGKIEGCELMSPSEREFRSSMISFRIPSKKLNDVMDVFTKDNVHVRPVGEGGLNAVRVSFHLYNDQNDLDRALNCVKTAAKS
jgi:selenocysteine lyase/cysteine desulfurase